MLPDRALRGQAIRAGIVLAFAVLLVNLFVLQVVKHRDYRQQAAENRQVRTRVRPPRGRILDRDGAVLADNIFVADISVAAGSLGKRGAVAPDSTLDRLLLWLHLPREETLRDLQQQRARGRDRLVVFADAGMPQIAVVEERRRQLPGAKVEFRSRRRYLHGPLLAHVLGYVSEANQAEIDTLGPPGFYAPGDLIGKSGLEAAYEKRLRGRAGVRIEEVNATGRVVGRNAVWLQPVVAGADLRTTLSLALQETLAAAMAGRSGGAVAVAVPSGEVLAACSEPAFDPNLFVTGISTQEWRRLVEDPERPLFNRIAQATYPPGSPYKIVTSLAGLEAGVVGPHTAFAPCPGGYQFGNRWFRCWKREGHGWVDHEMGLVKSCDTFYYQLGLRLDIDQLNRTALALHLGRKCGSPFAHEAAGNIPSSAYYDRRYGRRGWNRSVMLNNAIGQGEILVTPLQMALMTAAVASSGRVDRPVFLLGERQPGPGRLPLREENLAWVRQTMAKVVDVGTGTAARVRGVAVAGKTGTAQNPHGEDHAWFVCFAPAELPQVAMAILLENAGHGGSQAAPVAARWLGAYFARQAAADSAAARGAAETAGAPAALPTAVIPGGAGPSGAAPTDGAARAEGAGR